MDKNFVIEYQRITKGYKHPSVYGTPEEQGVAIKKCTILEVTNIGYSNETIPETNTLKK